MYFNNKKHWFINLILPEILFRVKTIEDEIYLTFDDGPHPEVTPAVLEILEQFRIKATFFCIGRHAQQYSELFEEIKKRGHSIGNHTYSHYNGWNIKTNDYLSDVFECERVFITSLFRPPYGKITWQQYKLLRKNYKIVFWTVMSRDFDRKISEKECLNKTIKFSEKGAIVVFHDNLQAKTKLLSVLPTYIKHFIEKGYQFKAL